jgi:hypothetical protein
MMQGDRLFWWERQVPGEWQSELDRAFPRHEHVSWLKLAWLAGTPERPIQRWGIYQMVPIGATSPAVLDPEPEFRQEMVTRARVPFHFPAFVPWQRRLVRETGQFGMLYWIVQGTKGGHRWMFSDIESMIADANGAQKQPPVPGALCYADFDGRAFGKVALGDRIAKYEGIVRFYERNPEELAAEDAQAVQEMRRVMWNWMDSQVDQLVDENRADFKEWADTAPRAREKEPDYEALEEAYFTAPASDI